jgi:hypothetical protein
VWEGYEFDIGFGEGQRYMGPFCLRDWAISRHVVNLTVVLSLLLLVLVVQVGASHDCVDGFEGWEAVALL